MKNLGKASARGVRRAARCWDRTNPAGEESVYTRASPPHGGPVTFLLRRRAALLAACLGLCAPPSAAGQTPPPPKVTSELDAFMQKVLARRDVNRQTLKQYILDETE